MSWRKYYPSAWLLEEEYFAGYQGHLGMKVTTSRRWSGTERFPAFRDESDVLERIPYMMLHPVMAASKSSSYDSSRVQRATRINRIESSRLQQRLSYIEQAKTRQCRLTNQDIRLISTSMVYIQSSSGHNSEAKHPGSSVHGDTQLQQTSPCFLYGERIWNRKRKRLQRPLSAFKRSAQTGNSDYFELDSVSTDERQIHHIKRPSSVADFRNNANFESRSLPLAVSSAGLDLDIRASCPSRLRDPQTPRQPWEDDISEVTKTILKAQAKAESGKRQSLFQSHKEAMSSHLSRNVRDLLRKIRISAMCVF